MTTGFNESEDFIADTIDSVFIVAFTEEDGELMLEAIGDLDNAAYRGAIVKGLREIADSIERDHSHEATH